MPSFWDISWYGVILKSGSTILLNVNHSLEFIRSILWFTTVEIPYWPLRVTTGFSPLLPFLVVM